MEDGARETARLFRVSKTVHELVHDRGYEISGEELNMNLEQFVNTYVTGPPGTPVTKPAICFSANRGEADDIYVYYSEEPSVGIKTMRKFILILEQQKITKGIIVFKTSMTPSANKVISAMAAQYQIEAFSEAELLVNITQHILVPQHKVLTNEEKKDLLSKYRLKDTQLPRIQLTDPVSRYYGLKRGQVVMITRPSETAGRYVSYRLAL